MICGPFDQERLYLTSSIRNRTTECLNNTSTNSRPRVLSGMRPTGKLHLGNYMGALANWVKLQDSGQYECYFFIADVHALTTDYADTSNIAPNVKEVALRLSGGGARPASAARSSCRAR